MEHPEQQPAEELTPEQKAKLAELNRRNAVEEQKQMHWMERNVRSLVKRKKIMIRPYMASLISLYVRLCIELGIEKEMCVVQVANTYDNMTKLDEETKDGSGKPDAKTEA